MTKTMGKFNVSSKFNTQFNYEGYSKQCEVAFRDYMIWCEKSKAPKALQAEYNRVLKEKKDAKTTDIFVLAITSLTTLEFEKATGKKIDIPKAKKLKEVKEFTAPDLNAMMANVGGVTVEINRLECQNGLNNDDTVIITTEGKNAVEIGIEVHEAYEAGKTFVIDTITNVHDAIAEAVTKEPDYEALYNEYKAGGKVADICKRENISKSTFYAKVKKFQ